MTTKYEADPELTGHGGAPTGLAAGENSWSIPECSVDFMDDCPYAGSSDSHTTPTFLS